METLKFSTALQKRDFAAHVENVLAQTSLNAALLEIEVTESGLIDSLHVASANLERLGRLGVGPSLDDFGVGYASLAYMQRFPFRNVKIDRTALGELERGSRRAQAMEGLVGLLHSMQLMAVAEGVEDQAILPQLTEVGSDLAQGFSLGRPMPVDDLTRLLDAEAKLHQQHAERRRESVAAGD